MANAWFVIAPVGESQGSPTDPKIPAGSKIVEVATNSAAYSAWLGNGSYNGWQVVMGPFATQAAAKSASPPSGLSYLSTLIGASAATAVSQLSGQPQTGSQVQSNVAGSSSLSGILNGLKLTWGGADAFLSRALKIIVGGTLLLAGIIKMTGAGKAIPVVAGVATKLPGV